MLDKRWLLRVEVWLMAVAGVSCATVVCGDSGGGEEDVSGGVLWWLCPCTYLMVLF